MNSHQTIKRLDDIRQHLPDEIDQARQVLDHRDQMLTEAQRRATQLLNTAKTQAESILSESALMEAVDKEAQRVRQQLLVEVEAYRRKTMAYAKQQRDAADTEAQRVRQGADGYAAEVLGHLQQQLNDFQSIVNNGLGHLTLEKAVKSSVKNSAKNGVKPNASVSPSQDVTPPLPKALPPQLGDILANDLAAKNTTLPPNRMTAPPATKPYATVPGVKRVASHTVPQKVTVKQQLKQLLAPPPRIPKG